MHSSSARRTVPQGRRAQPAPRDIPTVARAVDRFIDHRRPTHKSIKDDISVLQGTDGRRNGKRPYGRNAVPLAKSVIGNMPLNRTTDTDFTNWFMDRCPDALAASTRKRAMASLRAFLDYCWEQGWIGDNVLLAKQSIKASPPRTEWLGPHQVVAVTELILRSDVFDAYERFAWDLMVSAGPRAAEAVDFVRGDYKRKTGTLEVRRGKGAGDGKVRQIPVDEGFGGRHDAHVQVHGIRQGEPLLFHRHLVPEGGRSGAMRWVEHRRRHASPQTLRRLCDKVMDELDSAAASGRLSPEHVPEFRITPKVLRKTFACVQYLLFRMGKGGMDVVELQRALGHERLDTTQVYLADVHDWLTRNAPRTGTLDAAHSLVDLLDAS